MNNYGEPLEKRVKLVHKITGKILESIDNETITLYSEYTTDQMDISIQEAFYYGFELQDTTPKKYEPIFG